MDKNLGFVGGSTQPSAPPPTASPSYEEAVAHGAVPPNQPMNLPLYAVGPPPISMPLPYAQPPRQTTMPLPPSYAETIEAPTLHPRPQYNPDQNFTRSEVRIIHHIAYALGPNPVKMTCATCHTDIKTATISDHQPSAHICCVVLCLLGCCICSCLPYCLSTFMSVHHFCPNCKSYIGTWKR